MEQQYFLVSSQYLSVRLVWEAQGQGAKSEDCFSGTWIVKCTAKSTDATGVDGCGDCCGISGRFSTLALGLCRGEAPLPQYTSTRLNGVKGALALSTSSSQFSIRELCYRRPAKRRRGRSEGR